MPVPIVVDIQVFIGAVSAGDAYPPFTAPPPKSANIFADALALIEGTGQFTLWLSPHITGHISSVLVEDYGWDGPRADEYATAVVEIANASGGGVIQPTSRVADCPDYEDNRILELAQDSQSLLIISDDPHLLDMSPWRGQHADVPVMSPREFRDSIVAKLLMKRARRQSPKI